MGSMADGYDNYIDGDAHLSTLVVADYKPTPAHDAFNGRDLSRNVLANGINTIWMVFLIAIKLLLHLQQCSQCTQLSNGNNV